MASCQYWHANYFYITMYADIVETGSNYHKEIGRASCRERV